MTLATRFLPSSSFALTLKNLFLPVFCGICNRRLLTEENLHYCPTCWELSPRIERPFCSVCSQPHTGTEGFGDPSNFPCAECRAAKPPVYRRVYAAAHYTDAIRDAIIRFKFDDKPGLALPLAELMVSFAEAEMDCDEYDDIVAVPLHPVRQRARGYNQSALLVNELASTFSKSQVNGSLKRIRPTKIQSRITDEKHRKANVIGAFAVDAKADFKGRRILLVDDVVTTGGTVSECTKALKRAGAKSVDVLVAAIPVRK